MKNVGLVIVAIAIVVAVMLYNQSQERIAQTKADAAIEQTAIENRPEPVKIP